MQKSRKADSRATIYETEIMMMKLAVILTFLAFSSMASAECRIAPRSVMCGLAYERFSATGALL